MKGYEVFPRRRNPEMASKTPTSQVLALHEPLILTWAGLETGWAVAPWLWYVPQQETLRDVVMFTIGCVFTLQIWGSRLTMEPFWLSPTGPIIERRTSWRVDRDQPTTGRWLWSHNPKRLRNKFCQQLEEPEGDLELRSPGRHLGSVWDWEQRPNLLLTPQSVYSPALIGVVCVACYAVMQKLLMLMLTTVCRTRWYQLMKGL